jgi:hypothetical protein
LRLTCFAAHVSLGVSDPRAGSGFAPAQVQAPIPIRRLLRRAREGLFGEVGMMLKTGSSVVTAHATFYGGSLVCLLSLILIALI